MPLRLSEAQQLLDAVNDPLMEIALKAFFYEECKSHVSQLLHEIQKAERDVNKESRLAGKIDAYETAMHELRYFAQRQMKEASQ